MLPRTPVVPGARQQSRSRYPVRMSPSPRSQPGRRQNLGVALLASVTIVFVALRAARGLSFYDDSYYTVIPLRFAQGVRLFVGELSLQSIGEMVTVPFLKLYTALFGTTGIVLFVRELYIVIAAVVGFVLYRVLRREFSAPAVAIAVVLPMLALPYHLFAPTYNTIAQLCFTLAVVLGWASIRDGRRGLAVACGVALAAGAAAYPPLAIAAIVLFATYALVARKWGLVFAALGGATATALAIAAVMLVGLSADDIRRTIAFASANVGSITSPAAKLRFALGQLGGALVGRLLWPMWALAAVATVPLVPARVRAAALTAIPVAAAVPAVWLLSRGDGFSFGSAASPWLITLTLGIAVPSLVWAWRAGERSLLQLALLAAPFAVTGYVTIEYVTNSSWNRGTGSIAVAPLSLALLLCWSSAIADGWDAEVQWAGVAAALLVAYALLFANIFSDPLTWNSHALITSGPYAGITTSVQRRDELSALQAAAKRWVGPTARVTFLGEREAYLAVGGVIDTPAVWLPPASSDQATIAYYARVGGPAQVVFVDELAIAREGGYAGGRLVDPFLDYVLTNYHRVGTVAEFGVFQRN